MAKKVLVAMSGGVDSAVAALLLQQRGYDVSGITMRLIGDLTAPDINCIDAKAIADTLGIAHHIVSYHCDFQKNVIDKFLRSYINGNTPNPCVDCNRTIKFGKLWEDTLKLECDHLATGHYAKIINSADGKKYLTKAKDDKKDQSYFLWGISNEILSKVIFPLGEYTKEEIREIAEKNNFVNAHRSDSQDICFINNGDYATFIKENVNCNFPCGDYVDISGNKIGTHQGIINYTVGQRKGLGTAFGVPMFVGGKNAATNTVMLCTDEQLYSDTLTAKSINLLVDDTLETGMRLQAKIRYRHNPAWATVTRSDYDTLTVKFDTPQRAIAPGQSLVLYDGDIVVGGGIIQ